MTAYGHRATTVVALLHENGITPAAPGRLLHCWEWVAGRWKTVSCAFVKFCEFVKYAKYVCIYINICTYIVHISIYTTFTLAKKGFCVGRCQNNNVDNHISHISAKKDKKDIRSTQCNISMLVYSYFTYCNVKTI